MKKFIAGLMTGLLVIPIIDNLLTLIQQITKHIYTKIAVKTYEYEKVLAEAEAPPENIIAMGFQAQADDDNEEGFDEEE